MVRWTITMPIKHLKENNRLIYHAYTHKGDFAIVAWRRF